MAKKDTLSHKVSAQTRLVVSMAAQDKAAVLHNPLDKPHLYKLCDEAGIIRLCMHVLWHTYATKVIESGMQSKALQKLLGHTSSKATTDQYVYITGNPIKRQMV